METKFTKFNLAEWQELDSSCGKRSERLLLRTGSEGVRCTGSGCMCGAWSRGGGWSAAIGHQQCLEVAAGRQRSTTRRWLSWPGAVRTRAGRGRALGTVALCRAPFGAQCSFSNYSNFAQISKYKMKTILMSKIIETWHDARVDHSKQLLLLVLLPISNRIQVIKLGTNSTLNFSLNF
jgi:hypothetical protein